MLISQLAAGCDESNNDTVLVNANSYYSTTSWNVNIWHGRFKELFQLLSENCKDLLVICGLACDSKVLIGSPWW